MPEMTIALSDPGMGVLHRVGLAGLWMTLDAANGELASKPPGVDAENLRASGTWTLTPNSVSLSWDGDGKAFFRALFDYAYPVDDSIGMLHFRAFGDPLASPSDAFATHRAMLMTFLQHPQSRKAETGKETSSIQISIDGETDLLSLRRTTSHAFKTAPYSPIKSDTVAGWLVPGGAERHVGHGGSSRLSETPKGMLALRFAPVGCLFSLVRSKSRAEVSRTETSLVIPDVTDLEEYGRVRRFLRTQTRTPDIYVAGPNAAAMRLLLAELSISTARRNRTRGCEVVTYGNVAWSKQQRTRVGVLHIGPQPVDAIRAFETIRRHLPPRRVVRKATAEDTDPGAWYSVPQIPEFAASNLLANRPWWLGFGSLLTDTVRRTEVLAWERKGLNAMVNDPGLMASGEPATAFVRACHEAWRRRQGQLGERARTQSLNFSDLIGREYDRLRISFSRCKTQSEFRRTITDFWARGGAQPELREHWTAILPFITHPRRWEEGRDLALLAIASYAGQSTDASPEGHDQ